MMGIFQDLETFGHEQVAFFQDKASGLQAIIGIHSTVLGPALGGCRMWSYANEAAALRDVLRLSRGMTYKAALAGLSLGGGKAVIIGDSHSQKTRELMLAFGRAVDSLGGRYITAEDVGMTVKDIDVVRTVTDFAVGGSNSGGSGDPSVMTAFGVFQGMKAALKHAGLGVKFEDIRVAVQGTGNVGYHLCKYLANAGAKLTVTDIYPVQVEKVAKEFGAQVIAPQDIYTVDCDVFAPCALGAILNSKTIRQLRCKIIAGSANNQLESDEDGSKLAQKGILYVPDYAINAGGLINVAGELDGYNHERVLTKVGQIYNTIDQILEQAKTQSMLPHEAAAAVAEERLNAGAIVRDQLRETDEISARPLHPAARHSRSSKHWTVITH
jgi:leucine dehydrogenase